MIQIFNLLKVLVLYKIALLALLGIYWSNRIWAQDKLINIPYQKGLIIPDPINGQQLDNQGIYYGMLRTNISKSIQRTNITLNVYLTQNEIFRFSVHGKYGNRSLYLFFANDSILINNPSETVSFLAKDTLFDKILDIYKSKLVMSLAGNDSLAISLAPLCELNITPKLSKIYIDKALNIRLSDFYRINYFKKPKTEKFIRLVIPGYPSLVYSLNELSAIISDLRTENYKSYVLQYCINNQITDNKADPTTIEKIANHSFGVILPQPVYREISLSLNYSPLYQKLRSSIIILIIGFLVLIGLFIQFIIRNRAVINNQKVAIKDSSIDSVKKILELYHQELLNKNRTNFKMLTDMRQDIIYLMKNRQNNDVREPGIYGDTEKLKKLIELLNQKIEHTESIVIEKIDTTDTRIANIEQLYFEINNLLNRKAQ